MSKPTRNRVTRRSADELLDRSAGTSPSPISRVVSAACAPATPAEIGGESDAVMLFTAAVSAPSSPRRRRFMLKTALANLFAAKLATVGGAAAAAVATGGIAVAAVTGNLPTQGDDHPRPHPTHVASQSPNPSRSPESSPDGDGDHDNPATSHKPVSSRTPEPSPTVKPSPNPSLDGLCRAFQAGALNNDGKADESAAFTVLITAAGGKDKVTSYCATRIGTPKPHGDSDNHGKPSDTPGHGHDGNGSDNHGSDHRPGSDSPSPGPSEHPAGH